MLYSNGTVLVLPLSPPAKCLRWRLARLRGWDSERGAIFMRCHHLSAGKDLKKRGSISASGQHANTLVLQGAAPAVLSVREWFPLPVSKQAGPFAST